MTYFPNPLDPGTLVESETTTMTTPATTNVVTTCDHCFCREGLSDGKLRCNCCLCNKSKDMRL